MRPTVTALFGFLLALTSLSQVARAGVYCKYLSSCAEACYYYNQGYYRLDRDRDGIPCENLCSSPCGASQAGKHKKSHRAHGGRAGNAVYGVTSGRYSSNRTSEKRIHHREKYYQRAFCKKVLGIMEYRLRDGTRVDCYTSTYSFEVDFGHKSYEAIGQALHYADVVGNRPGIVLIKETKADERYIERIKRLAKKYHVYLFTIDRDLKIRVVK